MKTILKVEMILAAVLLFAFSVPSFSRREVTMDTEIQLMLICQTPQPTAKMFAYSVFRTAPLEVAKVFGRTPGCSDADADMIQATARAAVEADLDPAIMAATVGVESSCNQFAVSSKGAIGLTQIMPRVWKDKYDFAGDVNLFNRDTNLSVGAHIEADMINQFGTEAGIHHYNGMGTGCDTCDSGYASKILTLAGRTK